MLHIDEICLLIKELGIHILAINETKIDKNVHDDLVSIDGYTIKRGDRNRFGGGVAVYIKDTIFDKCTVRVDLPQYTLEALCIEVNQLDLHLSVCWLGIVLRMRPLKIFVFWSKAFSALIKKVRKLFS